MEKQHTNAMACDQLKASRDESLGQVLEISATPEEEKKVVRKLDMVLIPLMGICYMMQYMDKLALTQATLFGLRKDLNLVDAQYSWASAVFYFGYFAWSWPSSYLMVRLPLAKYLSVCVLVWGGVLMCHAAAKNFGGIMAARFFLGVGEASIAPGFSLIISMYYKREEQPSRQAAWFFGNCISNLISGVVAYGIGNIKITTITSWQLLFLFLGAVTTAIGFFILVILPDTPKKAIFLNERERTIAYQRSLVSKAAVLDSGVFKWNQAWLALRDPQTWFLVLYTFAVNLCNGGLTSFSGIIINGFGFDPLRSLLMQMPLGAAQIVFLVITTSVASFVPNTRVLMMIVNTTAAMIGIILVWQLDSSDQKGRLTGLALAAVFAVNIPLSLSLITSNVVGFTKRSTTSGLLFVAYCVGNIVGPQLFFESEEPHYGTGMAASVAGLAIGVFFLVCLLVYYGWENRRRDKKYGVLREANEIEVIAEGVSDKTDLEITSFRYIM
ncbi:major facilitator superfamily domain-containing protein [Aspergillus karnatakaensis]|uniref:major facilitator superfamily domain-containing protein n=1 Tax=Aspergillus karnatakaensis TaxID=1810916 RepID=UPI003CCC9C03